MNDEKKILEMLIKMQESQNETQKELKGIKDELREFRTELIQRFDTLEDRLIEL